MIGFPISGIPPISNFLIKPPINADQAYVIAQTVQQMHGIRAHRKTQRLAVQFAIKLLEPVNCRQESRKCRLVRHPRNGAPDTTA